VFTEAAGVCCCDCAILSEVFCSADIPSAC
jgi:hypothetical protein